MWVALLLGCSAAVPPANQTLTPTEPAYRVRPGVIESVDPIKEPRTPQADGDVFTAMLVGGLLFNALLLHQGTGIVVGAETGNSAIEAPPDGDSSTLPRYRVRVRFDDGGSMTLVYTNDVPFHRGEQVALTAQGLVCT